MELAPEKVRAAVTKAELNADGALNVHAENVIKLEPVATMEESAYTAFPDFADAVTLLNAKRPPLDRFVGAEPVMQSGKKDRDAFVAMNDELATISEALLIDMLTTAKILRVVGAMGSRVASVGAVAFDDVICALLTRMDAPDGKGSNQHEAALATNKRLNHDRHARNNASCRSIARAVDG